MKNLFGDRGDPEQQARQAIRNRKWDRAVKYYEQKVQDNERDFALWNLLGDLYINSRSKARAVDAWRRALEGYAAEGLHENVLGIARKILRRAPDEEDVHLLLAEAYLGLEYHADCLAAVRSYLKLSKHRSESELRSLFKRLLDTSMHHVHLLEEFRAVFKESAIEDYELTERLNRFVADRAVAPAAYVTSDTEAELQMTAAAPAAASSRMAAEPDGLLGLAGFDNAGDDGFAMLGGVDIPRAASPAPPAFADEFETPAVEPEAELTTGEGKDHYDLGMVYREMKLWDAAIAEFEQARRDNSIRTRATLALAECMQENNDLQGALDLLDVERRVGAGTPQEQVNVNLQLGGVHELLGNLEEALAHFEAVRQVNPAFGDVETRIAELRARLDPGSQPES